MGGSEVCVTRPYHEDKGVTEETLFDNMQPDGTFMIEEIDPHADHYI